MDHNDVSASGRVASSECKHQRSRSTLLWPPEANTVTCEDCGLVLSAPPGRVATPCKDCEAWIDTRCPDCGCCNHTWNEDGCPCTGKDCGCRENREWDEAEKEASRG